MAKQPLVDRKFRLRFSFWKNGIESDTFLLSITFSFIVFIDALDLRKHIGAQAEEINKIQKTNALRERLGHSPYEVASGIVIGSIIGSMAYYLIYS